MPSSSNQIRQSSSGSFSGNMQAVIGDNNHQQSTNGVADPSSVPTQSEVVELLTQIGNVLKEAELPESVKQEATQCVEAAKTEVKDIEPDKQWIHKKLKRAADNLIEVDKTLDVSKRIWVKIVPLLTQVSAWLGIALSL